MQTTATLHLTELELTDASALAPTAARRAWLPGLRRTLAQRWDLLGVVSLMASSAAYGLLALSHLTGF